MQANDSAEDREGDNRDDLMTISNVIALPRTPLK
jgi:hypothetical protein